MVNIEDRKAEDKELISIERDNEMIEMFRKWDPYLPSEKEILFYCDREGVAPSSVKKSYDLFRRKQILKLCEECKEKGCQKEWRTGNKSLLRLCDMEEDHLMNVINYLKKIDNELWKVKRIEPCIRKRGLAVLAKLLLQ